MKFIPYEKLSKKARRQLDAAKRRSWGALSPVTRKSRNKKYDERQKVRKDDFFDGPFLIARCKTPRRADRRRHSFSLLASHPSLSLSSFTPIPFLLLFRLACPRHAPRCLVCLCRAKAGRA